MGLMKNKKGIFFTIAAIALILLFALSYTALSSVEKRESVSKRVSTLNDFVFSMEQDMSRELYISGFRTIFILEDNIVQSGMYVSDLNSSLKEAFFNGTIENQPHQLLIGATFLDLQNSINEEAAKINANVTFFNPSIEILQEDPWNVKINFVSGLFVKDNSGLAYWNKTLSVSVKIPISNFEDPLYIINVPGLTNKMNKTVYSNFVSGSDVSNLSGHSANSFYIASTLAPSFIDRLEGRNTANANGVESLVYLPSLSSQGITVQQKSVVDYIYFSGSNPESNLIQGMPLWFRIDDSHLSVYQVSGLVVS